MKIWIRTSAVYGTRAEVPAPEVREEKIIHGRFWQPDGHLRSGWTRVREVEDTSRPCQRFVRIASYHGLHPDEPLPLGTRYVMWEKYTISEAPPRDFDVVGYTPRQLDDAVDPVTGWLMIGSLHIPPLLSYGMRSDFDFGMTPHYREEMERV